MNLRNLLITLIVLNVTPGICQRIVDADVCVYGGTSAGVIAAYTARQSGKTVILIEPADHLGGLSSGGLGYTDIGNKYAITGLARDFYRRVGKHYGKFEQWIFEPHVAKEIFQQYIREADVTVLYNTRLIDVKKTDTRITEAVFENAVEPSSFTNTVVHARVFIDCTYEGDLMARAGVSYIAGRESNAAFGETINGVQLMEGHQFPDGIDPYKKEGVPESGLVWGVSSGTLAPNGDGDKKIQAYNYRICLTDNPANRIPITRPPGYDSTRYELALRLMKAYPDRRALNDYFIWSRMPNHKTDINNRGGFSTDMIGMNYDYPEGDYETRKRIIRDHTLYTKGLLYFYGHDKRVPDTLRRQMLRWGYPKDEYTENDHWSPQLYVREARRMIGSYVMTQHNCEGREKVSDGVGLAAYTMDSHNCQRVVVDGQVKNEGNVEVGGFGPYPIAYRSITPKKEECTNLLVPVCLSATHIAYGSIRMEPVFMVLAQSAAVAAGMAIDGNGVVQDIAVEQLQKTLKARPLVTDRTPDILVDNDDEASVRVKGNWLRETRGGYGPSYLVGGGNNGSGSVRFTATIPSKGRYAVYAYFPTMDGPAKSVDVELHNGRKKIPITLKPAEIVVEGQTSGEWAPLGTFECERGRVYVEIKGKPGPGNVAADAVIFHRLTLD